MIYLYIYLAGALLIVFATGFVIGTGFLDRDDAVIGPEWLFGVAAWPIVLACALIGIALWSIVWLGKLAGAGFRRVRRAK